MLNIFICLFLWVSTAALARDNGQWAQTTPDVRQWFQDQKVPSGPHKDQSCCSAADGEQVQEDIRAGQYWIKGGHFPDWTLVPDEVVLKSPNKHGQPIVWWASATYNNGAQTAPASIRCYSPGAGI